jgi:ferrous iron transport protein B
MKENKGPVIIFIGQPNCGKSALFNSIAGYKAETSNFPGTTVKHTHSKAKIEGKVVNIIDLPGTYSLHPSDPAERVVLTHLFHEKPDMMINVVDASILNRSLELTEELLELQYPMVVALNMVDLAEKKGIKIDSKRLESLLGVPVVPTIATHGRGVKDLIETALDTLEKNSSPTFLPWSRDVAEKIDELEKELPEDFPIVGNKRFTTIKMIEAQELYFNEVLQNLNPSLKRALDKVRGDLESRHSVPAYEVISAERHHLAMKISEESSKVERGKRVGWQEKVDDFIMHPIFGYLVLLAVFLGFFFIIFKIGNPLEELLLRPLDSLRYGLKGEFGSGWLFYLLDGLIQGIGGGMGIVLPYFIPLLIFMSLLEDVGYMARAGFLLDTFMHRIGIHGNSVAPFILGFGCNVPAVIATRILRSRKDRIITSLLIPFIPCSARTTIILALVAFYLGPFWALGFYVFNILLVVSLGKLLSFFFKESSPGLILEIPSLKIPSKIVLLHDSGT